MCKGLLGVSRISLVTTRLQWRHHASVSLMIDRNETNRVANLQGPRQSRPPTHRHTEFYVFKPLAPPLSPSLSITSHHLPHPPNHCLSSRATRRHPPPLPQPVSQRFDPAPTRTPAPPAYWRKTRRRIQHCAPGAVVYFGDTAFRCSCGGSRAEDKRSDIDGKR